jgi:transcriptional regulator with XRE-family HTH domain
MAADQERADRIRALKQARPDLTWRRIADAVGVTERSATDWQKKGGIDYDNAKKLAEVFEVEVDYIWRGPSADERAPSPFAGQDAVMDRLDAIDAQLEAQAEAIAMIVSMLKGETKSYLVSGDVLKGHLEGIEKALKRETRAASRSARLLDQAAAHIEKVLPVAPQGQEEEQTEHATSGTRQG